ncbi:alpha/beta hydrolase [Aquimarina agarilytica]|uniref:alpha/beta hydrolase n=1 Tax=Aquimarina agarilytica TaxID=1087449 RepID=UPI0002886C2B|nr:alpha/beta hydrolase [Aquimarina agarilytica]
MQKQTSYTAVNTYNTLNELTNRTKNVWLVLHGIGYLSKFFIKHFSSLNAEENYIICPQAPSKYYKDDQYRRVGASWLTKENTLIDTDNVLNYLDAIMKQEHIPLNCKFIVLGYSQGVSIASRWIAKRKHHCDRLIFISGVFPKELTTADFPHLNEHTILHHSVGSNDPIFDPKNVARQEARMLNIFPNIKITNHNGGHELNTSLLERYLD